jgi:hypothetical protein
MENWQPIEDFPGYSVSDQGRVINDYVGNVLTIRRNQNGVCYVGLSRKRVQHNKSLPLLVANAFLERPEVPFGDPFDGVIHLDGDQTNNTVENLCWRPKWFVRTYYNQFEDPKDGLGWPVYDSVTETQYKDAWAAATACGILFNHLVESIFNGQPAWPTNQMFEYVQP